MKHERFDVVVLGSGFAGSLTAMILQRLGRRVALIDKARHPRFAIGESSTPIANMVLRDLANRYDLPQLLPLTEYGSWQEAYPHLGCGLKRGFSYFAHEEGQPFVPTLNHPNELLVAASSSNRDSDTHWLRSDVDSFLCGEARKIGVVVYEGCVIGEIQHLDTSNWSIVCTLENESFTIGANFVVDATGEAGVVPHSLGIESRSSSFHTNSRAIFSHFHGVRSWNTFFNDRGGNTTDHPFDCDNAAQHHLLEGAWMWVLRMHNDITSVGLVLDTSRHPLDNSISAEEEWRRWIDRYPSVAEMLGNASLATSPGKLIRTQRLQRRWQQAAGDDWALLPHTAGFVDALHSTGIAHSLNGVERLVHIVDDHWGKCTFVTELAEYSSSIRGEIELIDELVSTCFATLDQFDLFVVATMIYFAAVTTFERSRSGAEPSHSFLCADDLQVRELLRSARQRVSSAELSGPNSAKAVQNDVADIIAPINRVGLLQAKPTNMYRHTVTPT